MSQVTDATTSLRSETELLAAIVATQHEVATAGLDPDAVMGVITDRTRTLTGAAGAVVELAEGEDMVYRAAAGTASASLGVRLKVATSLSGLSVRTGEVLTCDDAEADDRVDRDACRRVGVRSMVVVPLRHEGAVVGVLKVLSGRPAAFGGREVNTLELMAGLLAAALHNARAFERGRAAAAAREAALRATELRFEAFMDNSPAVAFVKDADGRYLYASGPFRRLFGLTGEWRGKTDADLWPGDVAARLRENDRQVLAGGRAGEFEETVPTADGVPRRWLVHKFPFPHEGGAALGGIGIDVTDREEAVARLRRTKAELRRGERRYRTLVAALHQLVFVTDTRGEIVESAGDRALVAPGEPLTTAGWVGRIHPDDRDRVAAGWAAAIASGRPVEAEYRVRRHDGEWRRVAGRAIPVRGDGGAVEEWVGVGDDVTDRWRAEEELRRSERRYRTLVTASNQIVWVMSPAGEPVVVHGGERFFGTADAPVPVGVWLDHTHPDDRDRLDAAVAEAVRAEQPLRVEYRLRRADGQWRQMAAQGMPVRDEAGRVEEWVGVAADVTETRQLEEQLRQAQKMEAFGQLAGGVAHDFNNLLTIINGYSDLLLTSLPPADPMRDLLTEVHKAGERAGTLTRQLLLFSRQQVLEPRVLNLNAVAGDAEKMLRRLIGEDVEVATAFAPDLGPVKVDPGQIEQVLLNLCVNARDAMPTGGRVAIETRNVTLDEGYARTRPGVVPGDYAMLAVTDTGTGMDEATQAHMFEPFFTTKGPGKGTGLGLAVVFGVVKQSGGHLDVHSEVGRGTAFKLYFPRVQERTAPARTSSGPRAMPTGTETVLLAEDDAAVRALARRILNGCGYTVLEAGNGRDAVRVVEGHDGPLDLLISDVVMPHFGGRELAEKVLALRPGLKVLFLSGYTDDAVVRHGVLQENVQFLQKPFSPAALAGKVREALDAR